MRTLRLVTVIAAGIFLTSCSPVIFYQVYDTKPIGDITVTEKNLNYEDEHCIVYYNFWADGGSMGFRFFNKTDEVIYLDLTESYFIMNGMAYDYFLNRVKTYSQSTGAMATSSATASVAVSGWNWYSELQTNQLMVSSALSGMITAGNSVSYGDEKIIRIPPKTAKYISEYKINSFIYRDCDLYRYPSKKQIKTLSFTPENSPFVFSNRLAYAIGVSDDLFLFENGFYISEITNYPENEFIEERKEEYCGQRSFEEKKYFKSVAASMFYNKYNKGSDKWKH